MVGLPDRAAAFLCGGSKFQYVRCVFMYQCYHQRLLGSLGKVNWKGDFSAYVARPGPREGGVLKGGGGGKLKEDVWR